MTFFVGLPAPVTTYDGLVPPYYELVPIKQRHLTLLYFGDLSEHEIARVKEVLRSVTREEKPLKLSFHGLVALPSSSRPKHLAIRVVETAGLSSLGESLRQLLGELEKDRYAEFKPHVTIASTRRKTTLDLLASVEKAIKRSLSIKETLVVGRVALYKAEKGVVEPLSTYVLSGLP